MPVKVLAMMTVWVVASVLWHPIMHRSRKAVPAAAVTVAPAAPTAKQVLLARAVGDIHEGTPAVSAAVGYDMAAKCAAQQQPHPLSQPPQPQLPPPASVASSASPATSAERRAPCVAPAVALAAKRRREATASGAAT